MTGVKLLLIDLLRRFLFLFPERTGVKLRLIDRGLVLLAARLGFGLMERALPLESLSLLYPERSGLGLLLLLLSLAWRRL